MLSMFRDHFTGHLSRKKNIGYFHSKQTLRWTFTNTKKIINSNLNRISRAISFKGNCLSSVITLTLFPFSMQREAGHVFKFVSDSRKTIHLCHSFPNLFQPQPREAKNISLYLFHHNIICSRPKRWIFLQVKSVCTQFQDVDFCEIGLFRELFMQRCFVKW